MSLVLPTSQAFYTAKGWRIFIYLLVPPLTALLLAMPFLLLGGKNVEVWSLALFSVLSIGLGGFFVYGLLETVKGHFIIAPEGFRQVGAFRTRFLGTDAVKGYRTTHQYTFLVPRNPQGNTLKISYLTERYDEIQAWLATRYPNVDVLDQQATLVAAPADAAQGMQGPWLLTPYHHIQLLNITSALIAAWLIFYPQPLQVVVALVLALPFIGIGMLLLYPDLRLDSGPNGPGALASTFFCPGMALFIRLLFDFEVVSLRPMLPWIIEISLGLLAAIALASGRGLLSREATSGNWVIATLAAALFGFSAPMVYNAAFDEAPATSYTPRVLRKYINPDELGGFTLIVEPWGPRPDSAKVYSSRARYRRTPVGSPVRIRLRPGRLGVPWYTVE